MLLPLGLYYIKDSYHIQDFNALVVKRAWVLFPETKVNRNDPKAAESSFLATPTRWLEKQKSGRCTKPKRIWVGQGVPLFPKRCM